MNMLEELQRHNVITPYGVTPSVGQVGCATFGGYGSLSSKYGLGVDHIVCAKVVNSEGKILDADEILHLTGIRGGGGVILELTVKVYSQDQVGVDPRQ